MNSFKNSGVRSGSASQKQAGQQSAQQTGQRPDADLDLQRLEALVDELVKDRPEEPKVRTCMKAVGLDYVTDPIARLNSVLSRLDQIRAHRAKGRSPKDGEQEL